MATNCINTVTISLEEYSKLKQTQAAFNDLQDKGECFYSVMHCGAYSIVSMTKDEVVKSLHDQFNALKEEDNKFFKKYISICEKVRTSNIFNLHKLKTQPFTTPALAFAFILWINILH